MVSSRTQSPGDEGYSSAVCSMSLPDIYFTPPHLKYINSKLRNLEPQDILRWCLLTLPGLFQTTAFGLSGLVTLDMLSKITDGADQTIDLIFLDTLFHFKETLELVERVKARYPKVKIHVFKPEGCATAEDFNQLHGEKLWEVNDILYDYLAKVEPAERAYNQLKVQALLTGRRRSQGGQRGDLDVIEIDDAGLIKVNPLANWSFAQVKEYIVKNDVPYNVLLDRGYKSIGDWHSTVPVQEGEDERAGRWKGKKKTECGIHNPRSKYAQFLQKQEQKRQEEALVRALKEIELSRPAEAA